MASLMPLHYGNRLKVWRIKNYTQLRMIATARHKTAEMRPSAYKKGPTRRAGPSGGGNARALRGFYNLLSTVDAIWAYICDFA